MPEIVTTRPGAPLQQRSAGGPLERTAGTYRFAVDRWVDGAAHGKIVRSISPHGHIRSIDVRAAMAVPGVLDVITGNELDGDPGAELRYGQTRRDQPVLASDRVRYVGEPVAVVVAETRAAAEQAAGLVDVDIEELPFVVDQNEAGLAGAPQLHDEWPRNECGRWTLVHGDAERAMADAFYVHEATYRSPTANHAAMEPHVATASWTQDGALEVWTGTQAPYVVRELLSQVFGMSPERIRVRSDNLGGGFGGKLDLSLEGVTALAARAVGRPVRVELRRNEVFVTAAKHAATVTMRTGVTQEGLLLARIIDVTWNAGAYARSTPRASRTGMIRSVGPYHIPHVLARSVARYTNTVPTGPFRGAMTGQVCWAHESALDEIAHHLGIDPVEIRRRNHLRDGQEFATGDVMHDMRYNALLEAAAEGIGWDAEPDPTPVHLLRGRGVASVLKTTRTPSRSEAAVRVARDGQVTVLTSSIEMGQGASATLGELAARQLGLDPGAVTIAQADTAWTPYDATTSSSRTTYAMGQAVERAAADLRMCISQQATKMVDQDTSSWTHQHGVVRDPTGERSLPYSDIVAASGEELLAGLGVYESEPGAGVMDPETSQGNFSVHWHQGVVGVEVEVDTETGRVRVLRAHGASYAGRLVDALRARKQTEGGIIFGLGQALMEELVFDAGQPANPNLSDYQIPSVLDSPVSCTSTVLSDPDPQAEPHGIGETTVPPTAPAVANAIFAATGARVRDLPITAEKVLRALEEVRGE